jgi:hypothetical protein
MLYQLSYARFARATTRTRTADPVITNDVLYQLSYGGEPPAGAGKWS